MASKSLSLRAVRVLDVIVRHGPLPRPNVPELAAVTGTGPALYDSLLVLRGRFLVRWDEGGTNLRATGRGHELLRTAHYRQLLADPPLRR